MKKLFYLLAAALVIVGCKNKELDYEDDCTPEGRYIKVVVNWDDHETQSRVMRINLFSETNGVAHYGRDDVPKSGEKVVKLSEGASYLPFCYEHNATNVRLKDETDHNLFVAYLAPATRATFEKYGTRIGDEQTVAEPGPEFYVHCPEDNFNVIFPANSTDPLIFNFYPKNIVREFTFCIKNVKGINYIQDSRGDISGMSASYHFKSRTLTDTRATLLFTDGQTGGSNEDGYIHGKFYSFGPVDPCQNSFGMEIWSQSEKAFFKHWDVSGQIIESMADRNAKIARDGYDILIVNKDPIVIPPPEEDKKGSGFEVGVGEWNNVNIYL